MRKVCSAALNLAKRKKFEEAYKRLNKFPEPFADAPAAERLPKVRKQIEAMQARAEREERVKEAGRLGFYTGTYSCSQLQATATITVQDNKLRLASTGGFAGNFALVEEGKHSFKSEMVTPECTVVFKVSEGRVKSFELTTSNQTFKFTPK